MKIYRLRCYISSITPDDHNPVVSIGVILSGALSLPTEGISLPHTPPTVTEEEADSIIEWIRQEELLGEEEFGHLIREINARDAYHKATTYDW